MLLPYCIMLSVSMTADEHFSHNTLQ